jgi:hypothetical protein
MSRLTDAERAALRRVFFAKCDPDHGELVHAVVRAAERMDAALGEAVDELKTANHWRERHCTDSAAYAKQSVENWDRAKTAEAERDEARRERDAAVAGHQATSEAWSREAAGWDAAERASLVAFVKARTRAAAWKDAARHFWICWRGACRRREAAEAERDRVAEVVRAARALAVAAKGMFGPTRDKDGDEGDRLDGALSDYWQAEMALDAAGKEAGK